LAGFLYEEYQRRNAMSDPRFTDQRNDPVLRRDEGVSGTWGWIAGLAVLALIAFVLIAGWNSNPNSASNAPLGPSPMTTGSAQPRMSPPTTTGSGSASPMAPAPAPSNAPSTSGDTK
jgi:hypothetical protein